MLCLTIESYHHQLYYMLCNVVKSLYIHHFSVLNSSFVCDSTFSLFLIELFGYYILYLNLILAITRDSC